MVPAHHRITRLFQIAEIHHKEMEIREVAPRITQRRRSEIMMAITRIDSVVINNTSLSGELRASEQ